MEKSKNKITIFIDESGTLPDPQDRVIVVAAVGTDLLQKLKNITKTVRKKLRARKKSREISEIKFYQAGERTKQIYLEEIARSNLDIFALVVNKKGQAIPDSPENFATLCYILLRQCCTFYGEQIREVIFDKHFHRKVDQKKFNQFLFKLLGRRLKLSHVDSIENKEVNSADMVAGSLLWKYTGKDDRFYELIKEEIVNEELLNWKQAKRRFFQKKKLT